MLLAMVVLKHGSGLFFPAEPDFVTDIGRVRSIDLDQEGLRFADGDAINCRSP